jgi:hypothetical protein
MYSVHNNTCSMYIRLTPAGMNSFGIKIRKNEYCWKQTAGARVKGYKSKNDNLNITATSQPTFHVTCSLQNYHPSLKSMYKL